MDVKNEQRGEDVRDIGEIWMEDEADIDEWELWRGQGHVVPTKMYRALDRARWELHEANMRKREAKRLGEEHVTREILEAVQRADTIHEGLEILCFIRRDRVGEYRKEKEAELEDIRKRILAVERRNRPEVWREAYREEAEDRETTENMWTLGCVRIGEEMYLHAAKELEEYVDTLRELGTRLREGEQRPQEIERLREKADGLQRSAENHEGLAAFRREIYLEAKRRNGTGRREESGKEEPRPSKRAKKEE